MVAGTLPSGVVTFVLTDIEGSTRLLRRLDDRYDGVLERHVSLLRDTWHEHGGAHVSTTGDSCFAAFPEAGAALQACADAQRRLAAEEWPREGRPLVRMGVHTGLASPRNGDYVALAVHQAARVMAAAHGDQVLASEAAATERGADCAVELRPVGRYRLRDFDEPVQLYCLAANGLRTEFPAVRAIPVDGHNLAAPPTSFVGRGHDVAEVLARLGPGQLVTLTGPGGVGKSRLAIEAGLEAASAWDDGVWLVDLSPIADPSLVGAELASGIGAASGADGDRWRDALDHLHKRRALLVLDNCEHLAGDVGRAVAEVLRTCPDVGVLTTSREPLAIGRELIWRVNPLELPEPTASADDALESPSVQLFAERARAVQPSFALDRATTDQVVELCRQLDGLPLALELAAAQTAVLSVGDLLDGLGDGFRMLRTRSRAVPDRQRTMDAVMGWSYRLLSAHEQAVLRRLGAFRDGFSLQAALVAGDDLDDCDVLEVVWSLVDKSLVAVDLTANATRYRLLETVRAYARRLLEEAGEAAAAAARLTAWWLDRIGPWHRMDRARSGEIEVELDNLRALVPMVEEEQGQQLACSIGRYYYAVHAPRECTAELSRYARDLAEASPARVSLLATLALLHVHNGDVDAARRVLAEAEQVRATVGGAPAWDEVAVERALGEVEIRSGDHAAAVALARRTLERDLTVRARGRMLNLLAISSYFMGDVDSAEAAFRDELGIARGLGDEHLMAIAEGNVAELATRRGDVATAASHQAACLELALALGRPVSVAQSLIGTARLTADIDPARAARLHTKAESVLAENGHRLYDDDLRASEDMLFRVRDALGDDAYRAACAAGHDLTLPDATSLAQAALDAVSA